MPAQITALPTPPSTNDPANFNARADTFLSALSTFATEANAVAGEMGATAQLVSDAAAAAASKVVEASAKVAEATSQANLAGASAASALGAPGTNGSSTTSMSIGLGSKSFTTQIGKAWVAGQGFFLASSASPANWMSGVLTAYNSANGAATLEVDATGGSGTFAAWNCGLAAGRPFALATQAQAEAGTDISAAMTPLRTSQAIATQAHTVGMLVDAMAAPSSRWLPCNGGVFLNASYPLLAGSMSAHINPMVLRQTATSTYGMTYGGGVFLSWVYNGGVYIPYTSPDGQNWTARTNPFGASSSTPLTTYGNGMFVVVSSAGIVYSSPDGATWTQRASAPGFYYYKQLVYGGGVWVLLGGASDSTGLIATSTNLTTWTGRTTPTTAVTSGLAYEASQGRWLIVGNSTFWTSLDGITWSYAGGAPGSGSLACAMNGKFFISGSTGNGVAYWTTPNGSSFTDVTNGVKAIFGNNLAWSLYYDGARLLATGGANTLAWSADGVSWIALNPNVPDSQISGIARANSSINTPIVIAAGASGLRSGQDVSTTQFVTPVIAGRASGFNCYIKAA